LYVAAGCLRGSSAFDNAHTPLIYECCRFLLATADSEMAHGVVVDAKIMNLVDHTKSIEKNPD
jgi:hypothetical protein